MVEQAAIVTGPERGIGKAIAGELRNQGWYVIGVGRHDATDACDVSIQFDLSKCEDTEAFQTSCVNPVLDALTGRKLGALVNNAATQILGATEDVKLADWQETIAVNLTAPFLLSQAFLPALKEGLGTIVNIGSVHAQATKAKFVTYATSKAAIHGLTRALAVDLGRDVRVCGVAPAAIATEMLEAGFEGRPEKRAQLDAFHPAGRIGVPREVALAVAFLLQPETPFITGSILALDGGILARLHDPS